MNWWTRDVDAGRILLDLNPPSTFWPSSLCLIAEMVNSGWVAPYVCDVRLDFAVHSGQPYGSLIQQALTKAPATCSEQRSLRAHATLLSALTQNSLTTLTTVWRNETNPSQDPFRRLTSHLKTQTPISMLHNSLVRKTDQRIDRLFHTQTAIRNPTLHPL